MARRKRNLTDLHVTGVYLPQGDARGVIHTYLKKIAPSEHSEATRKASAAKARYLAGRELPDSDLWLAAFDDSTMITARENLVYWLISPKLVEKRLSVEAELTLGGDDENTQSRWAKDGYLEGLREAWTSELEEVWLCRADREGEEILAEALRVRDELTVFAQEVEHEVELEETALRRDYENMDDDDLRTKVVESYIEQNAGQVWWKEFHDWRFFFATRDCEGPDDNGDHPDCADHGARHFEAIDDVRRLQSPTWAALRDAYRLIDIEPDEGKDSRATRRSSQPSESPGTAAISGSSGLAAASS